MNKDELIKKNIEQSKLRSEIYKRARLKECFFNNSDSPCSPKIIDAHSLQRMGSLSILESLVNSNQSIYTLTERYVNPINGLLDLKPIGKKDASTFFGFCNTHDSLSFKPIEDNPASVDINNDEHCFLFSLKAFAISYHRKKEEINLIKNADESFKIKLRKFFGHSDLEGQLEGLQMGLSDMNPYKDLLTNAFFLEDYSSLYFFTYEIPYTAPVAMCMLTTPPFLFSGKPINISDDPQYKYSDILTSVIPLSNRTIIILGAFISDPHGGKFLDELDNLSELSLEKAISWHIMTTSENIFFAPKWWNNLNPNQKLYLIELSMFSADLTTPYLTYDPKLFDINFFSKKYAL